jgi:hypothetical protein
MIRFRIKIIWDSRDIDNICFYPKVASDRRYYIRVCDQVCSIYRFSSNTFVCNYNLDCVWSFFRNGDWVIVN